METTPRHALAEARALAARRSAPLILELDLTVDPAEGVAVEPLAARLGRQRPTLREIIDGLRRAGLDRRARVLIAHIAACGMPLARAQELRAAVADFRAAGGVAFAYADTFGEFGGGTVPYYLACAFDEIWLAPPGDLGLTGVASHTPFLRDALDQLGVSVELGARHEYKNAANTFVERGFTPAHLEATTRLVESCADEIVAGVSSGRGLSTDRVRMLVDAGPMSGRAALDARLVDRLGYRDEVHAAAWDRARGGAGGGVRVALGAVPTPVAEPGTAAAPAGPAGPGSSTGVGSSTGAGGAAGATADAAASDGAGGPTDGVGRATEGRGTEGRGTEGRATEGRATEGRGGEGRGGEGRGGEPAGSGEAVEPVLRYLSAFRRAALRREGSPVRRAVVASTATVATLVGSDRRSSRPAGGSATELDQGAVPPDRDPARAAVALIHGTGPVVLRRSGLPLQGQVLAAESVAAAFRSAARDPGVASAVFRVDSPGGSYVASDLVRREVERFRATGRPVIVSMGAVAASGGYFVSLAADTIVANPSTLTGSIGVYGGKQVISGLLDRLGVAIGEVAQGEHALMMSARRPFSPTERAKLEEFLDRVYDDFLAKVAAARGMTTDQVHELARGRVWTGADAYERGLVDELGGLERALRIAWSAAGLPGARPSRVRLVPRVSVLDRVRRPKSSTDRSAAAVSLGAPTPTLASALTAALGSLAPFASRGSLDVLASLVDAGVGSGGWGAFAGLAARAGLPTGGPLLMPPIGPIG